MGTISAGSFNHFLLTGQTSRLTPEKAMRFYRESSAVAIAVDRIASEIEQIRPVLLLEDGSFETGHELLELLEQPNGFESRDVFIGQVARHYLLTHDSLVYAEGGLSSPPSQIWAVKPQALSILQNNVDGYPQSYRITTGMARGNYTRDESKRSWTYNDGGLREVYQINGFSSHGSNTFSDSPLEAALTEVRQQITGRFHNLRILENGAKLSLIAIFKDQLDEQQLEQRRQALNEGLAGSENAGKIAVVNSDDLTLQEAGISNRDMDYLNLDKVATDTIAMRYDIPLPLISNDAATFNNLEQAVFHFFDRAVLPNFQTIYNGIGKMLMPRYGLDPSKNKITYNPDDIDALRARTIKELSQMITDKVITINEYRDGISRKPVKGGDDIFMSASEIPIARDVFTLEDIDDPQETAKRGGDDSE